MNETTENTNQENTANQLERSFTQKELEAILGERLAREREKYADYEVLKEKASKYDETEEANKSELQKAQEKAQALQTQLDALNQANEARAIREKVANEYKLPANLLTADSEDACIEQAKAIAEYAKPGTYPNVRDAGEANSTGGGTTREQFANFINEQLGGI